MTRLYFAGALLLVFGGTAEAKSVAWCQVNGAKYATYISALVDIDDGPDAFRTLKSSFGQGFKDYVQASLDPQASSPDCNRQDSRFYAEDYIDVLIKANPGYRFVRTGWRGTPRAEASSTDQIKRSGAQSRADSLRYRR